MSGKFGPEFADYRELGTAAEDFVAYRRRWKILTYLFLTVGFVILGAMSVGFFGHSIKNRHPWDEWISWLCIGFFGSCSIGFIGMLFSDPEQLRIGCAGILWRRWSPQLIPWSEIADVTTWKSLGQAAIVLHLRNPARYPGRGLLGLLAGGNRAMTGGDISLILSGTNRSFADALAAIERFRTRACEINP